MDLQPNENKTQKENSRHQTDEACAGCVIMRKIKSHELINLCFRQQFIHKLGCGQYTKPPRFHPMILLLVDPVTSICQTSLGII